MISVKDFFNKCVCEAHSADYRVEIASGDSTSGMN